MSTSRRRFLVSAAGAALALPALHYTREARASETPPRLLIYFMPNGRRPEWWVPSSEDGQLVFPEGLEALQPFANRAMSCIDLANYAPWNSPGAAHAMGTATILSGRSMVMPISELQNSTTIDQIIASHIGTQSRFGSLQWSAGEPGACDVANASCAYTQAVSWADYGAPLLPTINPAAAFDRLFGSSVDGLRGVAADRRRRSLRSLLDATLDDARRLERKVGVEDRQTLQAYFTSLRELERSLVDEGSCGIQPTAPEARLPYAERVAAFHELIRLAFQCDQTRVLSFMIEFGLSGRSHDFLGAPGTHHGLSHLPDEDAYDRLRIVEQWQNNQFAQLLTLLDETPGATDGASVLDETLVIGISSMGEGSQHRHGRNCPLLVSGSSLLQTNGQQQDFGATRPLTDLWVTLLEAYGIGGTYGPDGARFGEDGTTVIDGVIG